MGWMKSRTGIWGDEPQDIIDTAGDKLLLRREKGKQTELPRIRKFKILRTLLADKVLRAKIDKVFLRVWDRPATQSEYRKHIVAFLGGLRK